MQGRARLLILIVFVLILVVVAVVVLPSVLNTGSTGSANTPANSAQAGTKEPTVPPSPSPTAIETVQIIIAVQSLDRGAVITRDTLDVRTWPKDWAPYNAYRVEEGGDREDNVKAAMDKIVGKIARTDIFVEQPILSTMVVPDLKNLADVGSDAAAIIPNGKVGVALPMDRLTSVAYAIQDGDYVDIIVSLLFVDVDEAFQSISPNQIVLMTEKEEGVWELGGSIGGRPEVISTFGPVLISPSEEQRPRLVTQRTIQEAFVVHVGNFPIDGKLFKEAAKPTPTAQATAASGQSGRDTPVPATEVPPYPDIITLAVLPQDAVLMVWLVEARLPITFALRSAGDTTRPTSNPVTLDYIMNEYNVSLPGKTNFAIQPAIRSIRQLIGGELIKLSDSQIVN